MYRRFPGMGGSNAAENTFRFSDFVFVEEHVRNSVRNRKLSTGLRTNLDQRERKFRLKKNNFWTGGRVNKLMKKLKLWGNFCQKLISRHLIKFLMQLKKVFVEVFPKVFFSFCLAKPTFWNFENEESNFNVQFKDSQKGLRLCK